MPSLLKKTRKIFHLNHFVSGAHSKSTDVFWGLFPEKKCPVMICGMAGCGQCEQCTCS